MFYRHENDENWFHVVLKNVCKNYKSSEHKVEYTIPNPQPGRYTCQIQSRCEFGISGKSEETFVYKEEEVSYVILGPICILFKTNFNWLGNLQGTYLKVSFPEHSISSKLRFLLVG